MYYYGFILHPIAGWTRTEPDCGARVPKRQWAECRNRIDLDLGHLWGVCYPTIGKRKKMAFCADGYRDFPNIDSLEQSKPESFTATRNEFACINHRIIIIALHGTKIFAKQSLT